MKNAAPNHEVTMISQSGREREPQGAFPTLPGTNGVRMIWTFLVVKVKVGLEKKTTKDPKASRR